MTGTPELRESLRRRHFRAMQCLQRPDMFDGNEVRELLARIESQWNAEFPNERIEDGSQTN
jgi:hypothetical protein